MGCGFTNTEWHSCCMYIYVLLENSYRECMYIYLYQHRASGQEQRSSGGNTSSNPQVSVPIPRPVVNGMERMCQRHGSDQTPTLLLESKNHVSINSYGITYAVEEFLLSIIPNSVIVWSLQIECFFATIDWCSIMTGMYRQSMMICSSP